MGGSVNGAYGVTMNGAGVLSLTGPAAPQQFNALTITNGTVSIASNDYLLNTLALVVNSPGVLTTTGNVGEICGSLNGTGTVSLANQIFWINSNAASNFSGVYTGSGNALIVNGAGGVVTLSGSNSYTGYTDVQSGGTLSVASLNYVNSGSWANHSTWSNLGVPGGVASGTINLGSTTTSGELSYTGPGETTDRVINLNGTTGGATIDQSGSGPLEFTSALTATGTGAKTLTLQGSTSATGELLGAIVDNSSTYNTAVTKQGSGMWILGGSNTYTGTTTVSAGTLAVAAGGAIGSGGGSAVTVNGSGAVLNVAGVNGLTGTSSLTVTSGAAILGASNSFNGATSVTGTLQLQDPNAVANSALTLNNGSTLQLLSNAPASFAATAATLAPSATATINVANNGSGSGNTLTLSPTLTYTLSSGSVSTTGRVNVTSGNGYILSLPAVNLVNNSTSNNLKRAVLDVNPTSGTVSIGNVYAATSGSNDAQITLDGTTTGNQVTGSITNSGGWAFITKQGSGAWTLSGANTNGGGTTITAGTLNIVQGGSLSPASNSTGVTVNGATAVLNVTGTNGLTGGASTALTLSGGTAILAAPRTSPALWP